jgi:hypothetical protein
VISEEAISFCVRSSMVVPSYRFFGNHLFEAQGDLTARSWWLFGNNFL